MRSGQAGLTTSKIESGNDKGPRARARTAIEFADVRIVPVQTVAHFLGERHYLGATGRGLAWSDEYGVLVLAKPTARMLPQDGSWLELVRWCLLGERNAGSRQWKAVSRWLRAERPEVTTIVSYSDPSAGHTGALYKACNWTWYPTWHRLFPPPTGNGSWRAGETQAVKDRWVCELRPDPRRAELLRVKDGRTPTALTAARQSAAHGLAATRSRQPSESLPGSL